MTTEYSHPCLPAPGVPMSISEIWSSVGQPGLRSGTSARVVGRVEATDMQTGLVTLREPKHRPGPTSSLSVDTTLTGTEDFGPGSLVMVIGELIVDTHSGSAGTQGDNEEMTVDSHGSLAVAQGDDAVTTVFEGRQEDEDDPMGHSLQRSSRVKHCDKDRSPSADVKGYGRRCGGTNEMPQNMKQMSDCDGRKCNDARYDASTSVLLQARVACCVDRLDYLLYLQSLTARRKLRSNLSLSGVVGSTLAS